MEARIKEREATQLNNSITAPIFNMTDEQLSLDVAELGVIILFNLFCELCTNSPEFFNSVIVRCFSTDMADRKPRSYTNGTL